MAYRGKLFQAILEWGWRKRRKKVVFWFLLRQIMNVICHTCVISRKIS